jgi:hypothetical protein
MCTKRLVWGGLLVTALAIAAIFLLPMQIEKVGTILQLREVIPNAVADGSAAATPVFIAFDRSPNTRNLFYQSGGSDVWEQRGQHRLLIRFSDAEPQLELDSYATSILYLKQRMNTLSFHPFATRMKYRSAVRETEQLFRVLGLHDGVSWHEYEHRLDSPIENREVYVAYIALPSASLRLEMNCRWKYDALPRSQVDRAECYPIVYLTPKEPDTD